MVLHTQQLGDGPDLVLVHGWGMHGGIFAPLVERLAGHFRITLLDLPGHGRSDDMDDCQLDTLLENLEAVVPGPAVWVGWSLGGMVALAFADRYPQLVRRLILLASTPRFVAAADWPQAMPPARLQAFGESLAEDPALTIRRFLALVAMGAPDKAALRQLRAQVLAEPLPRLQGLQCGLHWLLTLDLRTILSRLSCPLLALLGERDQLVPVALGRAMQRLNPALELAVIEQAGHAPFLSHTPDCVREIAVFAS